MRPIWGSGALNFRGRVVGVIDPEVKSAKIKMSGQSERAALAPPSLPPLRCH